MAKEIKICGKKKKVETDKGIDYLDYCSDYPDQRRTRHFYFIEDNNSLEGL